MKMKRKRRQGKKQQVYEIDPEQHSSSGPVMLQDQSTSDSTGTMLCVTPGSTPNLPCHPSDQSCMGDSLSANNSR
ncbi:MAG: hypothetical protein NTNFB01_19700 [Nitrospira sp.]